MNNSQNPTPPFPSSSGNASALPLPDWVHNGTALPFRPLKGNSSRYNMGDINPEELNVFVVSMLCTMFLCNCAFVFTVLRRRWGLLENEFAEGDDLSAGTGSGSAVYQGVSSLIMKKLPVYMYPPPSDKVLLAGQTACCVCIDEYEIGDEVRILPCDHIFHVPCVDEWLQRSRCCPMCKQIVVPVVPAPRQGWGSGGRADRVDGGGGGGQGGGAGAARGRIENAHGSYANSGSELETAEQKVEGGEETVAGDVGVVGLGDIPSSRRSGRGSSRSGGRRFFQRFQKSTNVVPSPPSPGRIRRIEVGSAAGTLGGSVGTVGALDSVSNFGDTHGEDRFFNDPVGPPPPHVHDHTTHEQKHHDPVHAGGLRVTRGAGGAPQSARAHSTGASRHRVHPEVGVEAGEDGTTRTVQSNHSSPVSTEVAVATMPGVTDSSGEIDFS